MKLLPLYPSAPLAPVESCERLDLDPACKRCPLSSKAKHPCLRAEGEPGGLLIVGEQPSKHDDFQNWPFSGPVGGYFRSLVQRLWTGPVAFDNALRCAPHGTEIAEEYIDACRPYLAQTVAEVRAKRVLAIGPRATHALLGRSLSPLAARRTYGWLWNNGEPVPVFTVYPHWLAAANRFHKVRLEEDIRWALTTNPPKPLFSGSARLVETPEDAAAAVADLRDCDWFAWDVETAGMMFTSGFTVLSLAAAPVGADYAWVWDSAALYSSPTSEPLQKLMADPDVRKVGQNEKYDRESMLSAFGLVVRGMHGDTRIWNKLLDSEADADLDTMANLVGEGGHKDEAKAALANALKLLRTRDSHPELFADLPLDIDAQLRMGAEPKSVAYALLPKPVLHRYNARDAVVTAKLGAKLEGDLAREPSLQRIWDLVVRDACEAVARVESWGVPVSRDRMNTFHLYLTQRIEEAKRRLDTYSTTINWGSAPQLRQLLYKELKLPVLDYTGTGAASTDEATLKQLRAHHPIVDDILTYRKLSKLDSQYAVGLAEYVRDDERIHGSIHLDGARSGRTSMSNPNLQNIKRADDELGKMTKDCFVAPDGHVLLQADYSQLELRVAAMLSGDPEMRRIFEDGVDYHQRTAELIAPIVWGIKPDKVEKRHRTAAKAFNFGILYGMSDGGIAARAGCSEAEAAKIRAAIFGKMRRLERWIQERLHETLRTGCAWTWWEGKQARRRWLLRVGDSSDDNRAKAAASVERHSAWNTPIQGTASEFCVASLSRAVRAIEDEGMPAQLVLPIHDALLFVVPEAQLMSVAHEVRHLMLSYETAGVPLDVDVEWGVAWGSMEKLKLK